MRLTQPPARNARARSLVVLTTLLLAMAAFLSAALAPAAGATTYTALCQVEEAACPNESTYPKGTTVKAVSEDFLIESGTYPYRCGEAVAEFKTKASAGEPLKAEPLAFSLHECTYGGYAGGCEVRTSNLSEPLISVDGLDVGTIDTLGAHWKWECFTEYYEGFDAGTFDGTKMIASIGNGGITFNEAILDCEGWCTSQDKLTAHFDVVSPTPLYLAKVTTIAEEEGEEEGEETEEEPSDTRLCEAAETHCAAENTYPSETQIEASVEEPLTISTSLGDIECPSSTLKASTEAELGDPLPTSIDDWTIGRECVGSNEEIEFCEVTVTMHRTAAGSLLWTGGGSGTLTVGGGQTIYVHCEDEFFSNNFSCPFFLVGPGAWGEMFWPVYGGSTGSIYASARLKVDGGGQVCPSDDKSTLEAVYRVSEPTPLYVTE
jgi:hypothetical protein